MAKFVWDGIKTLQMIGNIVIFWVHLSMLLPCEMFDGGSISFVCNVCYMGLGHETE